MAGATVLEDEDMGENEAKPLTMVLKKKINYIEGTDFFWPKG
jgi:hypothetical protein